LPLCNLKGGKIHKSKQLEELKMLLWADSVSHKGRKLYKGQMVKVYFNLHKKKFSIKDLKTGLVVGHSDRVTLKDCTFKVSQAGRERVLREKKKNVHAFVIGSLEGFSGFCMDSNINDFGMKPAYYNPYKTETFIDSEGNPLHAASEVELSDKQIAYYQ
jgi:hypothetical protein